MLKINKLRFIAQNVINYSVRSISNVQSINFSDTHLMLKSTCRDFADNEITPLAAKIDREHLYPADIIRKIGNNNNNNHLNFQNSSNF